MDLLTKQPISAPDTENNTDGTAFAVIPTIMMEESMQTGPDFIIVGAAKSGTTIVQKWLSRQDAIFMTRVKEPHFFCFNGLGPDDIGRHVDPAYAAQMAFCEADYLRMFEGAEQYQIKGEASPGYLYFEGTAEAIYRRNPNTKIICLLRHPADRAYSQYMHHIRDGFEHHSSLSDALSDCPRRIREGYWWGYHYRQAGFYAERLTQFFQCFPRPNIFVALFDDLVNDPAVLFDRICGFLDFEPNWQPDFASRSNVASGLPRVPRFPIHAKIVHQHPRLGRLMARMGLSPAGSLCGKKAPRMAPATRQHLVEGYSDDIEATAKLIGRDLSAWLK